MILLSVILWIAWIVGAVIVLFAAICDLFGFPGVKSGIEQFARQPFNRICSFIGVLAIAALAVSVLGKMLR